MSLHTYVYLVFRKPSNCSAFAREIEGTLHDTSCASLHMCTTCVPQTYQKKVFKND